MYQQTPAPRYAGPQTASTPALLGQVLGIVAGGFVVTAAASYATQALGLGTIPSFVAMLIGFGFLIAIQATQRNPGLALLMFYLFAACEGIGIGPVVGAYARIDGGVVVVQAAATTAMGMFVLACLAYLTSIDFRRFSGIAFGMLIGLIIVSLIAGFTHFFSPTLISWGVLVVFSLLTLVDFSRLRNSGNAIPPVLMAVNIYLDAINIFIALLQIFGGGRRND